MAVPLSLPHVVLVTGTAAGVGKTLATAALMTVLRHRGMTSTAVKVVQTGLADWESGDMDLLGRLVRGLPTEELVRLRLPLPPDVAALEVGTPLPRVAAHARHLVELCGATDLVVVEGTGGLLTPLDDRRGTLVDLASALRYKGISVGFVVVARADADDLGVVALVDEVLRQRGLPLVGVIATHWPSDPGIAAVSALHQLPEVTGAPLLGRIPALATPPDEDELRSSARYWMDLE